MSLTDNVIRVEIKGEDTQIKKKKEILNPQFHLKTPTCIWGLRVAVKAGQSPLTSSTRPRLWCSCRHHHTDQWHYLTQITVRGATGFGQGKKFSPFLLDCFCFITEQHRLRRKCLPCTHTTQTHYAYKHQHKNNGTHEKVEISK